ncbi:hypothetical protein Vretimale_15867 [Volvox reticuliferus]|uniref:Uncharacterized protein n=1 Tax=Volvox reticuliferus TaxID=1737510 RepID=A0A8J4GRD7_9CHLO|nr:hypothetical protein Vretimale_15867 [Volvox reticuliferus]
MPSSESYGLPTGLRMPVLTAWDAATRRQPLPAQPNSGDDRRISSNNLLPLPAPPAMTMPLLYDAPYASPATPAMVLTAGRGPVRRRHDVPHHHSRSPIVANFERSLRHPLCAASASPSSPLSSSANSDSSPAAAAPSPSSEFAPPVLSAGEAWPSQTAAAASQQTRSGAEDPDLNSPDPDSVRARDGLSGNPQGDAETAVAASTQQEYGSGRATTPVKGRRGRPRKAPVAAISPPPPGGRGAGLIAHVPPTKRPRGRPRKQPLSDACTTVIVEPAAAKRGRGRPLKMVPIQNEPVAVETREEVKRPRGRPRRGGVPLTPAAASATQPKGDRRRVGVGLAAGTPAKAVGTKRVKAAAPLPPSEAVTEAAEGPVKPGRGRPRSPQSRTGANQNTVRTGILTPGGWTPRGPGSLCLEADRPYILAFYWGEPLHSPAPEPQSTASTTSVPASPPLSPHSTSSGANPGRRKSNSATTQPGSLELSYSVILLDGEDYSLEVVRKCGLRRVQLLGRGLRPTMCPPAATAAAAWAESVCEGRTGEAAEVAVATGVEFDVEWSLLDDEPTLSSAAKMLRPMTIGRLESANESMELMPDGAERDALLLLAARAPELQLTVERLVGEWAPRYDKCTLLSTILHVQSELYSLRREIINSGLSATAAAAAAAAVDDDDDATATRGAPVTAATTKGARGHPHQQENAVGDHPRGEPAAGGGSEMMMLPLRKVLGDMTGCEGSAPARLLVRAFVLRKLYLDLMTWVENPYERRHFLDAAAVAKTS